MLQRHVSDGRHLDQPLLPASDVDLHLTSCCPGSRSSGGDGCCSPQCCAPPHCCSPVGCAPCFCTREVAGYSVAVALMWLALPFALTLPLLPLFTVWSSFTPPDSVTFSLFMICSYTRCDPLTYPVVIDALPIDLLNALRASILALPPLIVISASLMSARLGKQQRNLPIPHHLTLYLHLTSMLTVLFASAATGTLLLCMQPAFLSPSNLHVLPRPSLTSSFYQGFDLGGVLTCTTLALVGTAWLTHCVTAGLQGWMEGRGVVEGKELDGEEGVVVEGVQREEVQGWGVVAVAVQEEGKAGVEADVQPGSYLPPYTPPDPHGDYRHYHHDAQQDETSGPVVHLSSPAHVHVDVQQLPAFLPSFSPAALASPPPSPPPSSHKGKKKQAPSKRAKGSNKSDLV